MQRLLPDTGVAALRRAMTDADFTVAAVEDLLGAQAHAALARNETTPALRRTGDGSALATLTRLWLLQAPVAVADVERALPGQLDSLCAAGILQRSVGEVRALLDVRPYADDARDWWVVSDLTPGLDGADRRMRADHVLGVTPASNSLVQLTVRDPLGSALDLGSGCGVQALHLTQHVDRVVGTDLNPRCLALAGLTAGLNDVDIDLREGSLFRPVVDESFDLVVSNPPFVISPGGPNLLTYRDSGLPGDEVVRRVVTQSVDHLNDGGWCQVLANWVHVAAEPWTERISGWLASGGCDAWVVEREQIDVARYVEMWLDDAGLRGAPDYLARYDEWLAWFDSQRVEAVGFGWLTLRKAGRTQPSLSLEAWPYEIEQPLGPHIVDWAQRVDVLDDLAPGDLPRLTLIRATDVVEERIGPPGDVDPASIVLRRQRGMRRARQVTTAVAALVGACDGDLSVGQITHALSTLLDVPVTAMEAEIDAAVPGLVMDGFVEVPRA